MSPLFSLTGSTTSTFTPRGLRKKLERYLISRSLRFNSNDSAYLSKDFASAGNRKTWTWAGWVKRSVLGVDSILFETQNGIPSTPRLTLAFTTADLFRLAVNEDGNSWNIQVSGDNALRDPSAWYHLILALDTTQATASDRVKLYINGTEVSYNETSYPDQNADLPINQALGHRIGAGSNDSAYFDGYLAEIHFIDGQSLDPTSFGKFGTGGVWEPIEYTGTYGTNGFHLDFSDNSSNAALGFDSSPNSNDWTPNNFSVIPGTGSYSPSTSVLAYGSPPANVLNMFDGSTDTFASTSYTQNITRFTPPSPIPYNSSVEIFVFRGNGTVPSSVTTVTSYIFNGGANTIFLGSGNSPGWITVATGSGSINYIEYRSFKSTGYVATSQWYAIRVDGTILVENSLTANNDILVDSPTNGSQTDTGVGGEVVGNYATLNPLDNPSSCTLSNGNLTFSYTATQSCTRTTLAIAPNTGKYYWENHITTVGAFTPGIADAATNKDTDYVGESAGSYGLFSISGSAYKYNNNSGSSISGTAYGNGDIVMIAYDSNTGKFYGGRNGLWYNGGDPVAGTNPLYTATSNTYFPAIGGGAGGACAGFINFGQRPFAYTAPAGFKCLCSANLP